MPTTRKVNARSTRCSTPRKNLDSATMLELRERLSLIRFCRDWMCQLSVAAARSASRTPPRRWAGLARTFFAPKTGMLLRAPLPSRVRAHFCLQSSKPALELWRVDIEPFKFFERFRRCGFFSPKRLGFLVIPLLSSQRMNNLLLRRLVSLQLRREFPSKASRHRVARRRHHGFEHLLDLTMVTLNGINQIVTCAV